MPTSRAPPPIARSTARGDGVRVREGDADADDVDDDDSVRPRVATGNVRFGNFG
jgi:hypothetical protein